MKSFKDHLTVIQEASSDKEMSPRFFFVNVPCNVYSGKYYEAGVMSVKVEADSEKSALKIIKSPKNKQAILDYLNETKLQGGKRAISVEDYKNGNIQPEKSTYVKLLGMSGVSAPKRYISQEGKYVKG